MRRRNRNYRPKRAKRQAIGIVLSAVAATGVLLLGGEHVGSAASDLFAIPVANSEPGPGPRIHRGGDAWRGTGSARREPAPAPTRAARGAQLIDHVTRVRDGDTIVVGLIPIRIANLDCAETGTMAGDRATRRMQALVRGQQLTCRLEGRRSWDREVGLCALPGGRDIGEVLIAEGLCERWPGY